MLLNDQTSVYQIHEIPDPADSRYKAAAGGNVCSVVFASGKHLLRQIAHMLPMSIAAEVLFVFEPQCKSYDRQFRLRQYLRIWTSDSTMAKNMNLLVQRGELSRFYKFERIYEPIDLPQSVTASCDIIRRQDFIEPLHNCEFNPKIPNHYNNIHPFTPNEKNDLSTLDRILDGVTVPVVISVRVQPADISNERRAVTAIMEQYRSINHSRDFDNEDYAGIDYIGSDDHKYFSHHSQPSLLNLKDPMADDIGRSLRDIHESLCHRPHLFFNIRITAETEAAARLVGGVFAEAAFEEGDYRLIVSKKGDELFDKTTASSQRPQIAPLPVYRYLRPEESVQDFDDLRRLVQMATVEELTGAFRLPVASFSSPLCIRRNTDPVYEDIDNLIILGCNEQGIEGNKNPIPVGITLKEIRKHVAIFGLSGFGKTTVEINIFSQLHNKHIPTIVIETSKTEYRVMKKARKHKNPCFCELARDLEIYTLGNERCSPYRLNPQEIPPGIEQDAHIVSVRDNYLASMANFPALPGILSEALEEVYESYPFPDSPPVIAELYAACVKVLSEKSYCGEVSSNIRGALDVRLGELTRLIAGKIFKCRNSIPSIEHLMSSYSVIEMDILSQDQKCLITLFFLSLIREHLKCLPPADGLRLVVIISEIHNIFSRTGEARPSDEAPDPKAYVVELISRLLVELRSLGVGIILSDQHPSEVDPSAVKSTCTKIACKEIYGDDREMLAVTMLLSGIDVEDIARLKVGEAYFFKESYFRPMLIKTTNLHEQLDLTKYPTDKELLENIKNDKWFQDMAIIRMSTELDQLKEYMDKFENKRIAIMKRIVGFYKCYKYILEHPRAQHNKKRIVAVINKARKLKKELRSSYESFHKRQYKMYLSGLSNAAVHNVDIETRVTDLTNRFESVVKKGTDSVCDKIEKFIKNCKKRIRKGDVS